MYLMWNRSPAFAQGFFIGSPFVAMDEFSAFRHCGDAKLPCAEKKNIGYIRNNRSGLTCVLRGRRKKTNKINQDG